MEKEQKNREPVHRDWVKLWTKDCLLGSIRDDLTVEERSIWYDFLILAGASRVPGVICANKTTPYPARRIASILNAPEALIKQSIEKFKTSERITIDEAGLIHIVNWARYQYSDYDRVKKYRERKKEISDSVDNDLAAAIACYEQNFGLVINPTAADTLADYITEHGLENTRLAIEEAVKQGKRNLKYVGGILRNSKESGRTPGEPRPGNSKDYNSGPELHLVK